MTSWLTGLWPELERMEDALHEAITEGIREGLGSGGEPDALAALTHRLGEVCEASRCGVSVANGMIHGHPVSFESPAKGQQVSRELADLLWVASLAREGTLLAQRVCFIQTKVVRDGRVDGLDHGQLELLSLFPRISLPANKGGGSISVANRSGMLGAYGFMQPNGELPLLAAPHLSNVLGGHKSRAFHFIGSVIAGLDVPEQVPAGVGLAPAGLAMSAALLDCGSDLEVAAARCLEEWVFLGSRARCRDWSTKEALRCALLAANARVPSILAAVSTRRAVQAWIGLRLGEQWLPEEARTSAGARALAGLVLTMAQAAGLPRLVQLIRGAEVADEPETREVALGKPLLMISVVLDPFTERGWEA